MFPDPGEELFSSLLEEEERTPPDVFSDLSTVLLRTDLRSDGRERGDGQEIKKEGRRRGEPREETRFQKGET